MSQSNKTTDIKCMETIANKPETDTVKTKFGELTISRFPNPVGYSIRLVSENRLNKYTAELGDVEASDMGDFMESIKMAGAPLLFVPANTAQVEIMDALKELCQGTDHRYVISKLKGIPK